MLTFVDRAGVVVFSLVGVRAAERSWTTGMFEPSAPANFMEAPVELVVTDVVLVPESGCRNRVGRLLVGSEELGVYRSTDERGMLLGGVDFDELVVVE